MGVNEIDVMQADKILDDYFILDIRNPTYGAISSNGNELYNLIYTITQKTGWCTQMARSYA